MTTYISTRPEGIHLLVSPITFGTGSEISTMVGCTITAFAQDVNDVETEASSTAVLSATSVEARWSVGTLAPGKYLVDVYATAGGGEAVTIFSGGIVVREELGP